MWGACTPPLKNGSTTGKKSLPLAVVAPGRLFLFLAAGLVAVVTAQPALYVHLVAQRGHFGIPSFKVASEACDHAKAFCKLAVEGCGFICKITVGSGVGFGSCRVSRCNTTT